MTTVRFCVLVGLVIGVMWACTGIAGAAVTALVAGVGGIVGAAVQRGAVDLSAIVGRRDDD